MKILFLLFVCLSLVVGKLNAQKYLTPVKSAWERPLTEFEQAVKRTLIDDKQPFYLGFTYLRYMVLPSWCMPEYVMELQGSYLVYKEAKESISFEVRIRKDKEGRKEARPIPVTMICRKLADESKVCLLNLFRNALFAARFEESRGLKGVDGADFYFSFYSGGMMTAKMDYPVEGTETYELIRIASDIVRQLRDSKDGVLEFTPKLLERMRALIKKMPPPPSPLPKACLEGKPLF